ncbi:Glutamate receptor ionotropic, kainate 5 [Chionoecetes opilio]|uniref:Glutamate receptor ionotropic, kainate 5 n=1 Tax=Chionoecetes opilio TaxID=41210 RepID=A0A8J5CHI1_CHIOP|nr:Glutamate receptor ionotropic, kainate 5 [Chionoecetes opilio]
MQPFSIVIAHTIRSTPYTGSPYTNAISEAILNLQEEGKLQALRTRWWKMKKGGGQCTDEVSKSSSKANELGLNNVGGVFVVLLAGMGLASVTAVCEFVWKSRKLATEEHVSVLRDPSSQSCCSRVIVLYC